MIYSLLYSIAMETNFHVFSLNINILRDFLKEHCLNLNLLQLSHSMFCKNIARLTLLGSVSMCDNP